MKEWRPFPKQEKALLSTAFETLFGGSRGPGKTDAGIFWTVHEPVAGKEFPINLPQYRCLVIRKNYTDLKDWRDRAEFYLCKPPFNAKMSNGNFTFPSGAKIILGHLKDSNAYQKYQGHEYQRMLIEELTHIPTEEQYLKLISSCRSTVEGLDPRVFATTNPGEVGHRWVKKRFVDPVPAGNVFEDQVSGRTRLFVRATVDDNPILMERDPDYVKFLDSLPPDIRKRWREGSWENIKLKGAYFADDMEMAVNEGRVCRLETLPHELVYVYWDLGVNDMQVAWFVQFKGRDIRLIDVEFDHDKPFEYYTQLLREKGYDYAKMVLPHDGTKRAPDTLKSFRDVLEDAGHTVQIVPRTKDKNRDIQQVRTILPRCWFDAEKCSEGINALNHYRREWDEDAKVFKNRPVHDWSSHYCDAFMALAVTMPEPRRSDKSYKKSVNSYIKALKS